VADDSDVTPEESEGRAAPRMIRAGAAIRGLAVDITPLRRSREFRTLWFGQLVSVTGRQITVVALPFQVFLQTGSPLAVGMIGLVQVVPLVAASIVGGAIADRVDRRRLLLATELGLFATSGLLLAGALAGEPPLWYLYAVTGMQAAIFGVNTPTRSAVIPNLVPRDLLPAALALGQVMFTTTMVAGPALAGVILGAFPDPGTGLVWAYAADVVTFFAALAAVWLLPPLPPLRDQGERRSTGWQDIKEGFAYLAKRRVLISTFLIDLNAMIFGMPRALFPVLALTVFRVGPEGLGLLHAALAAGALAGALTAGWVGRIRHQGRAVMLAVAVWGAAIAGFGLSGGVFAAALAFLAIAGAADVISAVFRSSILLVSVPDALRGRLSAAHIMVVTGGPRLGDVEAGLVASLVSPLFSVVSGGLACILGVVVVARLYPELRAYHAQRLTGDDSG
jgi:predicted MFS family arabinose efflux permease